MSDKIIHINDLIKKQKDKEKYDKQHPIHDFGEFLGSTMPAIFESCFVLEDGLSIDFVVWASDVEMKIPMFKFKIIQSEDEHTIYELYSESNIGNIVLHNFDFLMPNLCWHCLLKHHTKGEVESLLDVYMEYSKNV